MPALLSRCATVLLSASLLLFAPPSHAQNSVGSETALPDVPELPLAVSPLSQRSLSQCADTVLQARLEQALSRPGWSDLIAQDDMAVGVVDLSTPTAPRYAAVNGDEMMYAASLPKIGILYAAARQMETGELSLSSRGRRDLHAMIRSSSNAAATRMIDRVGGIEAVNRALTDAPAALYDPNQGGGLWVGKRFSSDSQRQPDPLKGLSHAATVHQVARFYTLTATGRLINRERSAQMLDALSKPGLDHKFVHVLQKRAPNAAIYRKSGSWRHWHADSALVWGPNRRYVIVALVDDEHGGRIIRSLLPAVEEALGVSASGSGLPFLFAPVR